MSRIIPIKYPSSYTTLEKRFIINDIICVGYSIIDDFNISVLFAIHQDLFDKYEYINININIDNNAELRRFRNTGMYIKDLQKDRNNNLKIQDMCRYLTSSNLYTTDLDFERFDFDDSGALFYLIKGIRNTGKDIGVVQEYSIHNSVYIQLRMFKEFLKSCILSNKMFFDDALKNVSSITPTHCKLDGTAEIKITKRGGSSYYKYISHYTIHSGPTTFKLNYQINSLQRVEKAIREPMIVEQYDAQYGKDSKVTCTLYEDSTDKVLVVIVDDKKKKTTVIELSNDLYKFTNFKDMYNYIFYSIDSVTDTTVPHIKF